MHPHTTMQLAAIRQDELLRAAASRRRATSASRKPHTRWGRAHREQGVRS